MWFIGVEVEQETSAPPPKKNPGSAPEYGCLDKTVRVIFLLHYSCLLLRLLFSHTESDLTGQLNYDIYDMKVKILYLCLLFVVLCEVSSNSPRNAGTETQEIVASVQQAGGCCGVVNENCGKCTPEGQMQGFEPGHGCCLPVMKRMEKKISGTGPLYWCCQCGFPNLQPIYGQTCCAGNC